MWIEGKGRNVTLLLILSCSMRGVEREGEHSERDSNKHRNTHDTTLMVEPAHGVVRSRHKGGLVRKNHTGLVLFQLRCVYGLGLVWILRVRREGEEHIPIDRKVAAI